MKVLKNLRKEKLKKNKGAVSLLVAITLFTFITILTGTFVTVAILRKSQSDSNIKIKQIYEKDVDNIDEVYNTIILHANRTNGEWNRYKEVNNPKLYNTGLIPVYFDENGNTVELTSTSTQDEWDGWFDYDNGKWANAVTKDSNGNITGYFVWIPRFAYKITSELGNGGQNITGNIDVVFIDNNNKNNGITYSENYPAYANGAMNDYVVHPAFTGNINNGGWDNNISGFWVAKYPAAYQAATIHVNSLVTGTVTLVNSEDTVVYSNSKYSSDTTNIYGTVTKDVTSISYPVFKPLTFIYNSINIGDCYTISREIQNATGFYGLSNIDSHLEKNSEWGAVAYLTQSKYGRNMEEININNFSHTTGTYRSITGLYANGKNDSENTTSITYENAYNTTIGQRGSSTGNIYGVYDLNGGVWERTAGYILNENENIEKYGSSFTSGNTSTKYATVYSYDSNNDSAQKNMEKYSSLRTSTYGFGDSVLETSRLQTGNYSWNEDVNNYAGTTEVFFSRGGRAGLSNRSGLFARTSADGKPEVVSGFRVVLIVD